jgi:hypothetical protein
MRKTNSKSEDINEENTFVNSSKDILGDLKLIQSNSDNSTVGVSTKDSMASIRPNNSSPVKSKKNPLLEYTQLDIIGSGSYGKVIKVQQKKDGKYFAMKAIDKIEIEKVSTYFTFKHQSFHYFCGLNLNWFLDEQNIPSLQRT